MAFGVVQPVEGTGSGSRALNQPGVYGVGQRSASLGNLERVTAILLAELCPKQTPTEPSLCEEPQGYGPGTHDGGGRPNDQTDQRRPGFGRPNHPAPNPCYQLRTMEEDNPVNGSGDDAQLYQTRDRESHWNQGPEGVDRAGNHRRSYLEGAH